MKPDLFNYDKPSQSIDITASGLILQGLSSAEREAFVGFTVQQHFRANDTILAAGQTGRSIRIVQKGRVRGTVHVAGRPKEIDPMGPGAVFGELAFFDGAPASATLWAEDEVQLLALDRAAFETLSAWHPRVARLLLLDLGRVLAARLRHAESRM